MSRRSFLQIAALALALSLPAYAQDDSASDVVTGQLQLIWGDRDPHNRTGDASQFRVNLVTQDGRKISLDPESALLAAGNLYALYGQRVAVAAANSSTRTAGQAPLTSLAIVALRNRTSATTGGGVSGPQPWVTIMCKFAGNSDEPKPLSYFVNAYGTQPEQLGHYWQQVSYNKINLAGSTAKGWFSLPHPRSYYVSGSGDNQEADLNLLFDDCTAAADPYVDFSQYVGIWQAFNDDLDGYAWGGGRTATLDGTTRYWRVTWQPPWSFANLAPAAHEMGHGFGLPHANNSDGDGDPYDNPWDVMSDSWYNAMYSNTYGTLPKHVSIWSRDTLGWIDAGKKLVISGNGSWSNVLLSFAELGNPSGYREIEIQPPGAPDYQFFTLEARQASGTYDGNLAGTAVIVHHVDTTRDAPAWSVDRRIPPADRANNRESMFWVGDGYNLASDVRIDVVGQVSDGFLVDIAVGASAIDMIFQNGFEP